MSRRRSRRSLPVQLANAVCTDTVVLQYKKFIRGSALGDVEDFVACKGPVSSSSSTATVVEPHDPGDCKGEDIIVGTTAASVMADIIAVVVVIVVVTSAFTTGFVITEDPPAADTCAMIIRSADSVIIIVTIVVAVVLADAPFAVVAVILMDAPFTIDATLIGAV